MGAVEVFKRVLRNFMLIVLLFAGFLVAVISLTGNGSSIMCVPASGLTGGTSANVPANFNDPLYIAACKQTSSSPSCQGGSNRPQTGQGCTCVNYDGAPAGVDGDPKGNCTEAIWIDTGIYTTGIPVDLTNPNDPNLLRFEISGQWMPWGAQFFGSPEYLPCVLHKCDPSTDQTCLTSSNPSDIFTGAVRAECQADGQSTQLGGVTIDDTYYLKPCALSCGWGLYAMIAIDNSAGGGSGSGPQNPNDCGANTSDPKAFRMFRVAPAYADASNSAETSLVYKVPYTQYCFGDNSSSSSSSVPGTAPGCIADIDPKTGQPYVPPGKLYLKIVDNIYNDNSGGYNLNIYGANATYQGFFSKLYDTIQNILSAAGSQMQQGVAQEINFIDAVRAMLALYIVIFGLTFILGMVKMHYGEFITRLLKIALVATLISPGGIEFFNVNFLSLFESASTQLGNIIMQIAVKSGGADASLQNAFSSATNPFNLLDIIFALYLSEVTWIKIQSLIFTKYIIYIPVIIFILYEILIGLLRTATIYLMSTFMLAILVAVSPIFLSFMLFQITSKLFKDWINLLISNGLMLAVTSLIVIIFIIVVYGNLNSLMYFGACQNTIFSIFSWSLVWYEAIDYSQVEAAFSFSNIVLLLIGVFAMNSFMEQLPGFIDSIVSPRGFGAIGMFYNFANQAAMAAKQNVLSARIPFTGSGNGQDGVRVGELYNMVASRTNMLSVVAPVLEYKGIREKARRAAHLTSTFKGLYDFSVGRTIDSIGNEHQQIADFTMLASVRSTVRSVVEPKLKDAAKAVGKKALGASLVVGSGVNPLTVGYGAKKTAGVIKGVAEGTKSAAFATKSAFSKASTAFRSGFDWLRGKTSSTTPDSSPPIPPTTTAVPPPQTPASVPPVSTATAPTAAPAATSAAGTPPTATPSRPSAPNPAAGALDEINRGSGSGAVGGSGRGSGGNVTGRPAVRGGTAPTLSDSEINPTASAHDDINIETPESPTADLGGGGSGSRASKRSGAGARTPGGAMSEEELREIMEEDDDVDK